MNLVDENGVLILTNEEEKKCSRCKQWKESWHFSKNQSWCKSCQSEYKKQRALIRRANRLACGKESISGLVAKLYANRKEDRFERKEAYDCYLLLKSVTEHFKKHVKR